MTSQLSARPAPSAPTVEHRFGPLGRLGVFTASHARAVIVLWVLVVVSLGAFAPRVEHALAGAGWEASGSESVAARDVVQQEFAGLSSAALQVVVHTDSGTVATGTGKQAIDDAVRLLRADPRVSQVVPPQAGLSIAVWGPAEARPHPSSGST